MLLRHRCIDSLANICRGVPKKFDFYKEAGFSQIDSLLKTIWAGVIVTDIAALLTRSGNVAKV